MNMEIWQIILLVFTFFAWGEYRHWAGRFDLNFSVYHASTESYFKGAIIVLDDLARAGVILFNAQEGKVTSKDGIEFDLNKHMKLHK